MLIQSESATFVSVEQCRAVFYCRSKADMMMNRQRKLLNLPRSTSTHRYRLNIRVLRVQGHLLGRVFFGFIFLHLFFLCFVSLFLLFLAAFVSFSFQEFCISPCDLWVLYVFVLISH